MAKYNGWHNRATWNASLWLCNEESYYRAAVDFMKSYQGRQPYRHFCRMFGLEGERTPDGILWMSRLIHLGEMNALMQEIGEQPS